MTAPTTLRQRSGAVERPQASIDVQPADEWPITNISVGLRHRQHSKRCEHELPTAFDFCRCERLSHRVA